MYTYDTSCIWTKSFSAGAGILQPRHAPPHYAVIWRGNELCFMTSSMLVERGMAEEKHKPTHMIKCALHTFRGP